MGSLRSKNSALGLPRLQPSAPTATDVSDIERTACTSAANSFPNSGTRKIIFREALLNECERSEAIDGGSVLVVADWFGTPSRLDRTRIGASSWYPKLRQ